MKLVAKLLAVAAMALALNAHGAEPPRKEAVIDTGGLRLVVSAPADTGGPYDFARNQGVLVNKQERGVYGEVMFNAGLDTGGVVVYLANAFRRTNSKPGDQPVTAEHMAQQMIKAEGFAGNAKPIPCPQPPIPDGAIACYQMAGTPTFEGVEPRIRRTAAIVAGVATSDNRQGYALMVAVMTKTPEDVKTFDADPSLWSKMAKGGLIDLFKYHRISFQ